MSLAQETAALRERLATLADASEAELTARYALPQPPPPKGLYFAMRRLAGRALRWLGLYRSPYRDQPWEPGLKHAEGSDDARPILIWAVGEERDTVRAACRDFQRWQAAFPGYAFVLVTDVADFAFYSRLGWLVEYLPELSGMGDSYRERKQRYLAWRYRDALALPLSAARADQEEWRALLESRTP